MKKVLLFFMIMVVGALLYVMSFTTDSTSSSQTLSSTIFPLVIIYGFFGIVLYIIGKKGHDLMLPRWKENREKLTIQGTLFFTNPMIQAWMYYVV
jgi:hypothetical protein